RPGAPVLIGRRCLGRHGTNAETLPDGGSCGNGAHAARSLVTLSSPPRDAGLEYPRPVDRAKIQQRQRHRVHAIASAPKKRSGTGRAEERGGRPATCRLRTIRRHAHPMTPTVDPDAVTCERLTLA